MKRLIYIVVALVAGCTATPTIDTDPAIRRFLNDPAFKVPDKLPNSFKTR